MRTYVDIAKRLVVGSMAMVELANGSKYMGEVATVSTDGTRLTLNKPYVWEANAPRPRMHPGWATLTITSVTRVYPQ